MLFKKKGKLKKEYDQKLLSQIDEMRSKWLNQKNIWEKSFDINEDLEYKVKISKLKYYYLFKEAKVRNIKLDIKNK
ncbi:YaaL family protein [Pallidibacillus pasinlerensis]|uniref:YaaL family protein n=1 Tax=Pallidibacillus pasinlerensis TaxID=2703818 RepID=A0ABX0A5S0_9BACI|nr:YaaL family protein [Pallidibacillus pasinlerensis]NCU18785.1 YaaL family protein [Pallidibacillus pasinlerensis]